MLAYDDDRGIFASVPSPTMDVSTDEEDDDLPDPATYRQVKRKCEDSSGPSSNKVKGSGRKKKNQEIVSKSEEEKVIGVFSL